MSYKKIRLTSPVVDLHGVLLRESIREALVKKMGKKIRGSIGNIRNGIEVVFDDTQITEDGLKTILLDVVLSNKLIHRDFRDKDYYDVPPAESATDKKEFSIERSGELQETVWALQGAGKVFEKIANQIKERDDRKLVGILKGVRYEIYFNSSSETGAYFHTKATEEYLCNIPWEKENLIELMQEYLLCCKSGASEPDQASKASMLGEGIGSLLDMKIAEMEGELNVGSNKNDIGDGDNDGG